MIFIYTQKLAAKPIAASFIISELYIIIRLCIHFSQQSQVKRTDCPISVQIGGCKVNILNYSKDIVSQRYNIISTECSVSINVAAASHILVVNVCLNEWQLKCGSKIFALSIAPFCLNRNQNRSKHQRCDWLNFLS